MGLKGDYISFEGICCAGKTTVISKLGQHFTQNNIQWRHKDDLLAYQGIGLGRDIKNLLNKARKPDDPFFRLGFPAVETLLMLAKRVCEAKDVLNPAITAGEIILADRDIDTTCTYQLLSFMENGLPKGFTQKSLIKLMRDANRLESSEPDLTFFLDVSMSCAKERLAQRSLKSGKDSQNYTQAEQKDIMSYSQKLSVLYSTVLEIPIKKRTLIEINTTKRSMDNVFKDVLNHYTTWKERRP